MPVLKNARHEAFAQALAKGMTADAAYQKVGYKPSRAAASRLSAKINIRDRVAEIVGRGAQLAEIDIARTLQEMARLGTSDVRRLFDKNGNLLPISALDDDTAAAISSVEVVTKPGEADEDGKRTVEYVHKLKLWDKNSALEKIAKHLGMFVERVEHSGKVQTEVSDLEFARRLAFLLSSGVTEAEHGGS